jgi:hypothetical protein
MTVECPNCGEELDAALPDDADLLAEQVADRVRQHVDPGGGAEAERVAREVAKQLDYTAIASQVSEDVVEALR